MTRAFVTGVEGTLLSADERRFLADCAPWGLILFRRNVESPEQLRRLTDDFRAAVGWNAPVLVDQEGGRVQRLGPPHWRKYPSGALLARAADAADDERLIVDVARLMAADLTAVGINVDCAPCLDLARPETTLAIGDRSYGGVPLDVVTAGRAFAAGLMAGGVLPVIKHIPGHGRATVDSHHDQPVVTEDLETLRQTDFAPFYALADLPAAMTAHVVYTAIDPDLPSTLSPTVIGDIVRDHIGFNGLLFSDDLSMKALKGSLGDRASAVLAAGCDMPLYCAGNLGEMIEVAAAVPDLQGEGKRRAEAALASIGAPEPFDADDVVARLDEALAAVTRSAES